MRFCHIFRHQFRKSTTCDTSTDEIPTNEHRFFPSMNKIRGRRRFSLVKFELPPTDSNGRKDSITNPSPNLLQKLLFRQFSPKTRPYSSGISVN